MTKKMIIDITEAKNVNNLFYIICAIRQEYYWLSIKDYFEGLTENSLHKLNSAGQ